MVKRHRHSDASVVSVPVEAPPTTLGPAPGTSLMELPTELLGDVARRAFQLGAGGALSLTCRALANTNLSHAPSLHIQLNGQGCDQFLSGRSQFQLLTPVDAVLRARTCKLALTLEQQEGQDTGQYITLVTNVMKKLGSCAAVEACNLGSLQGPSLVPPEPLDFSPDLAQHLTDSFPGLTSLSLHGYAIPCSGLASLLGHPQLSLQLQQLDLTGTNILQPKRPEPGAATLDNLFNASRLKQLSLLIEDMDEEETKPLLPNLQPLSSHLTQLCIQQQEGAGWCLDDFTAALLPLAQLQVLTITEVDSLGGLPGLLKVLPQLHTLQLPDATVRGDRQLAALLSATQLTSIQLKAVHRLRSSHADARCSWQQLELTGSVDYSSAAYLPLHSLTQPLLVGKLFISVNEDDDNYNLVEAAVHNLAQACKVPMRIKVLWLNMGDEMDTDLQELVDVLQVLNHCSWEMVCVDNTIMDASNVLALAPLCQACTQLVFSEHIWVNPSLEFWRQLVQLMPTVTNVVFKRVEGSTSSAMHESLQLMAEQSWARWLDICIIRPSCSPELPACWMTDNPSKPGKLRVWFKA